MKMENAIKLTSQTLVGGDTSKYPVLFGNCFSVETDLGKEYRIVNFKAENWEEMLRRGLELPVKILPLGEKVAIIHDDRIPDEWHNSHYCETCCPRNLLPEPQKLAWDRKVLRGEVTEHLESRFVSYRVNPLHETFPLFYEKPEPLEWKGISVDDEGGYTPRKLKVKWTYQMEPPVELKEIEDE